MILRTTFILFTLLSSLSASATDYWKHSEQQGEVGSCHTFAAVALVEAEYRKSTGKHINLSERDLFVRHYIQGDKNVADSIRKQLIAATLKKLPDHYKEAGHISEDFTLLQRHGVASERELGYSPTFSQGVSLAIILLRQQRNLLSTEADLLKGANSWDRPTQQKKIQQRYAKLSGVIKTLTLPADTTTRRLTKKFLSKYTLKKFTPKTTKLAKQRLIKQLAQQPVAVDITNLSELSGNTSILHGKHSLVASHYHPKTDQFTIRSSTFKGAKKVAADTLARGTYQMYYLENK